MKSKIIFSFFVFLLLFNMVFADVIVTNDPANEIEGDTQEVAVGFFESLFQNFELGAVVSSGGSIPSDFTCEDRYRDALHKFTSKYSTDKVIGVGNYCSDNAIVQLFQCSNDACTSKVKDATGYKIDGVNPKFTNWNPDKYYAYHCYECSTPNAPTSYSCLDTNPDNVCKSASVTLSGYNVDTSLNCPAEFPICWTPSYVDSGYDCTDPNGIKGQFFCYDTGNAILECDPEKSGFDNGWYEYQTCDSCELYTVQNSPVGLCKTETQNFCYRCDQDFDGEVLVGRYDSCPAGWTEEQLGFNDCVVKTTCYKCGQELATTISQTVIGSSCPAGWTESILGINDCGGKEFNCVTRNGIWDGTQCTCEAGYIWVEDLTCIPDVSSVSYSSFKGVPIFKSDIKKKTTDELLSSACIQDNDCLESDLVKSECLSLSYLRDKNLLSGIQKDSFLEKGKNIFYGTIIGTGTGFIGCGIGAVGSAVLAGATFGAAVPIVLSTAALCAGTGAIIGGIGTAAYQEIAIDENDPLVKAFKAEDENSVGLCVVKENSPTTIDLADTGDFISNIPVKLGLSDNPNLLIGIGLIILALAIIWFIFGRK